MRRRRPVKREVGLAVLKLMKPPATAPEVFRALAHPARVQVVRELGESLVPVVMRMRFAEWNLIDQE